MIKTAMILAAGRGDRMRPLTDTIPKPLIPVAGKSMIERALDKLEEAGVTKVVVNVHHLGQQIADRLSGRAHILHEDRLLETGGSVKAALPVLGAGPFFILNGDMLWRDGPEQLLPRMALRWNPERMDALLLLHPIHRVIGRDAGERGDYFLEPGGHLRHRGVAQLTPYVFASLSICDARLFEDSPDAPFSLLTLWHRAEAARRLYGTIHEGDWFHVGTPKQLAEAERILS